MLKDLWVPHPATPQDLVIAPTTRDPSTMLALSSRNAYLSSEEKQFAPTLYNALQACSQVIKSTSRADPLEVDSIIQQGIKIIDAQRSEATQQGVQMRSDYIALNDVHTLQPLTLIKPDQPVILSGALWVGKTRLIDNLVLNTDLNKNA